MNVLFVCTGNTCRSPMAEVICRSLYPQIHTASRGVAVDAPAPASVNAQSVLAEMGLDLSKHIAAVVQKTDMEQADLVLTMTARHRDLLKSIFPEEADKVYTLKEYAGETQLDIVDPFGGNVDIYRACAQEIKNTLLKVAFV